jgi:3-hydroxybutyryl-CoA dehydratase
MVRTYFFDELHLGQRETLLRTIMDRDVHGFAGLTGDENPIHLSEDYASRSRFGQRIAHGMFTASLISAVIGMRLPGPGAVYLSQTLSFRAPVRIGDVVAASVEVAELLAERRRVRLACECRVDTQVVLEGEAWVSVPARRT